MEPTTSPLQSLTYYVVHNTESAQIQCAFNASTYKLLWKEKSKTQASQALQEISNSSAR